LSEQQLLGISKVASSKNIIFKIQLVAVKKEMRSNHSLLKSVSGTIKKEKGEDGFYRYYTGNYKTYENALEKLNKIKEGETTKDAFIVAFKDGKKITVADAKKIVK
jgi:N-acetylmuramoyl-L-alanine amidase